MQFKTLFTVSAIAAIAAADYQGILNSLTTIDKDTAALNKTVLAFDGSNIFAGIPILAATSQLQNDLKAGTANANKTAPLTSDQAIGLIGPVGAVAQDSNITVTTLINKYPAFKKAFLTGIVASNLKDTRTAAKAFSDAVIAKVPDFLQDSARVIAAPIDASFAKAIAVYSQSPFGF